MPKKLKFLFKSAVVLSFFWAMFVLLYLQEITVFGDGFLTACDEKGITLPLERPHILVDVSDGTLTISDGDRLVRRYDIANRFQQRTRDPARRSRCHTSRRVQGDPQGQA